MRAFLFVKAALLSLAAIAQTRIDGVTSVIASIEIHDQCIRFHGFDARASGQLWTRPSGEHWRCGQQAALALAEQIQHPRYRDRSGRIVAACLKVTLDLKAGWLQAAGPLHSGDIHYAVDEDAARRNRINIWSGNVDMPWDWRSQRQTR
jgi:endonuclease YncB( thermonuclease family)